MIVLFVDRAGQLRQGSRKGNAMRRWQLFSVGAVALTAAVFAAGSLQSLASSASSGQSKTGAGKPDPMMSAMCERSCAARDYGKASVVAQPGAHRGQLTRCPVSGVVFKVHKGSSGVAYAGKEWVTCCGTCAKKLAAAPERFLGPLISGGGGAQIF
jgi:hypothetical protein